MEIEPKEAEEKSDPHRLKTLAEQKYISSNLKSALKYAKRAHRLSPSMDGLSEMLTALKILRSAADADATTTPHWYRILQLEPFSHINTIKKQYKKLALILHPDKNSFVGSGEAFKLVGDAFRVLSDRIRRKEYDMRLRIAMQDDVMVAGGGEAVGETFWTACSTCRLLHQFERRYLGHNLMCPNCRKSFKAVEVVEGCGGEEEESVNVKTRVSARIRMRRELGKMSSIGEVLENSMPRSRLGNERNANSNRSSRSGEGVTFEGLKQRKVVSLRDLGCEEERGSGVKVSEGSKRKRVDSEEETMTLAEMQVLAKEKVNEDKLRLMLKDKEREKESEKVKGGKSRRSAGLKSGDLRMEKKRESRNGDLEIMAVEDSDFYNFDKGRVERSFKKGQVWAIYDDDDGMPRHYGLINEVVSTHPFELIMSWLDLQSNGDEGLACGEKRGFHISCGRFKVSQKTSVKALNVFSHLMDCERAAREVYRIYPKKGSVWALYNENALDAQRRNFLDKEKRCYDIVVFLTSYSEMHGLSMAYLEKVAGFKTVFKRKEIGCHAIRWLEKNDVCLFSHQIPARKLSGEEAPDLSKDCWELDPASLPRELLTSSLGR